MNNDGWGQVGAGASDNRIAGRDLQHYRQGTKEEAPGPKRVITQPRESGGPMKHQKLKDRLDESLGARHGAESHHMQSMGARRHESEGMSHHYGPHHGHHGEHHSHHGHMGHEGHHMHHHLEEEKDRHEHALEHHKHHMEKHHSRHYNTQHGHDTYHHHKGR